MTRSLRGRLFLGIGATVAASVVVMLVIGAVLTRSSLESDALRSLERQVELLARERTGQDAAETGQLGDFLATEQMRLAVLTPEQAGLLLPPAAATTLRERRSTTGRVTIRGDEFLYAARIEAGRAFVLLRSARRQAADWRPFLVGLGLAAGVGALLAAAIAFVLARAVARPLSDVAEASRHLGAGDDPAPLPARGPTEVAALAAAFNELAAELGRARAAERSFLLSVSHELKTPLTAIRGHAEAIADGVVPAGRAGEVIEREAHRLERLIGDLLDLARLRRRAFTVETAPIDLEAIAHEAVDRYAGRARELGVSLSVDANGAAPALGDAGRMLQAVSNLVENAIRCAGEGRHVTVRAGPGTIAVVDDGPGLRPEDAERAFERFYLWERYGAERPVGTGLGLAVVHELIEAMHGTATVSSIPGAGTTFTLTLPAAPRERP